MTSGRCLRSEEPRPVGRLLVRSAVLASSHNPINVFTVILRLGTSLPAPFPFRRTVAMDGQEDIYRAPISVRIAATMATVSDLYHLSMELCRDCENLQLQLHLSSPGTSFLEPAAGRRSVIDR
jgi:hypothetical protein